MRRFVEAARALRASVTDALAPGAERARWLAAATMSVAPRCEVPDDAAIADLVAQTASAAVLALAAQGARVDREALRALAGREPTAAPLLDALACCATHGAVARALDALIDAVATLPIEGAAQASDLYEHFLAGYHPRARAARGVYFTPAPLVEYVLCCVDDVLRDALDLPAGLGHAASAPALHLLDPAAGTGAFLRGIVARAGSAPDLRARLHAIEVLPGPHLAARVLMAATGEAWPGISLADALDGAAVRRAIAATRPGDVMVVVGNPPYAGHSASRAGFARELLRGQIDGASYFATDGVALDEKNPKWLNDDYVKFVRLAQWCVETVGRGVVALVCNHGFLDHPTFRAMRRSLMRAFDQIHVLDLHGSAKRRERAPDGSRDDNVFAIAAGVAVIVMVRRAHALPREARVHHAELWGTRAHKLAWLGAHRARTTPWQTLAPRAPQYRFVPEPSLDARQRYERGIPLDLAMPVRSPCVVTARDATVVDFDAHVLASRLRDLLDPGLDDATVAARHFATRDRIDLAAVRARMRRDGLATLRACLYRPFDRRWLLDHPALVTRPRATVMRHLAAGTNRALIARRQAPPGAPYDYLWITDAIAVDGCIRSDNHGSEAVFPLYLLEASGTRRANFAPDFIARIERATALSFTAETHPGDLVTGFDADQLFDYLYARLSAPGYRAAYRELLAHEYPRVPLPADVAHFAALARLGSALAATQLAATRREHPALKTERELRIERLAAPRFERDAIYCGSHCVAAGVAPEDWDFRVGSYRVLHKWLEVRRNRALGADDLAHYRAIVRAVATSRAILREIDALAPVPAH